MTMKEKKARFEAARPQQENVLLTFTGVDGYDVYNCSIPFTWEGREYIFGRVERREEWARSWVRLFEKSGKDTYALVPGSMIYQLEDPFIQMIHGELVLGGTSVEKESGNVKTYRGYFYRGKKLDDLAKLVSTQELTITGELANEIGGMDSTSIVNDLKLMLDETQKMTDDEIRAEIIDIAGRYNVSLTNTQIQQLIDLCRSLEGLDADSLKARVEEVQGTLQKTKVVGFVETVKKVVTSVSSFFDRIKDIIAKF